MAGLYVVEQAADFATIDRELRRFDDRLSLTFEIDSRTQHRVYQVLCQYAGDHVAVLCEWRDEWGFPLPLSSGLIEQVRVQRAQEAVTDYAAINAAAAARAAQESDEEMDEITRDMGPRISAKRSAVLQRGAGLRRARDRRRARGEKA